MTSALNRHDPRRVPVDHEVDPPLTRDPARLALLASAALLALGSLVSWAVGADSVGHPADYRATAGTGEGVVLIAGAGLLVFLARDRLLWETSSRTVQVLPVLVALISVAMWIGVENFAGQMIDDWQRRGGTGELTNARYLVLAGIGLAVFAFAWIEWKRPEHVRRRMRPLLAEWGVTRWSAAAIAMALAFGALGASLSIVAIIYLAGIEGILPAVILGVFGLFGGIAAGMRLARWLETRARR